MGGDNLRIFDDEAVKRRGYPSESWVGAGVNVEYSVGGGRWVVGVKIVTPAAEAGGILPISPSKLRFLPDRQGF